MNLKRRFNTGKAGRKGNAHVSAAVPRLTMGPPVVHLWVTRAYPQPRRRGEKHRLAEAQGAACESAAHCQRAALEHATDNLH